MIILKHHHEPIIGRELWDAAQAELKKRNRRNGAGHGTRYLFSGKIQCGVCGAGFVSRRKKRGDGTDYQCWCCRTAAKEGKRRQNAQGIETGCDIGKMLRNELALEIFKHAIGSLQIQQEQLVEQMAAIVQDAVHANPDAGAALASEIARLSRKKENALDAFFSETITKEDLEIMLRRYEQELESLQNRLTKANTMPSQEDLQQRIAAIASGRTASEAFCKNLLDHMTVCKDKRIEVRLNFLPQQWTYVLEPGPF